MDPTEQKTNNICFKIIALLDGIPMGRAHYILNEAAALLNDCHIVDTEGPRFKMKLEEFGVSLASSD